MNAAFGVGAYGAHRPDRRRWSGQADSGRRISVRSPRARRHSGAADADCLGDDGLPGQQHLVVQQLEDQRLCGLRPGVGYAGEQRPEGGECLAGRGGSAEDQRRCAGAYGLRGADDRRREKLRPGRTYS